VLFSVVERAESRCRELVRPIKSKRCKEKKNKNVISR